MRQAKVILIAVGIVALIALLSELDLSDLIRPTVSARIESACPKKTLPQLPRSNPPPKETEKPKIPPAAEPVRIHWRLKLPYNLGIDHSGEFSFRKESDFEAFLGANNKHYAKWNGIDFTKQMTILSVHGFAMGGNDVKIESVWRMQDRLIAIVHILHSNGQVTAACEEREDGVVINRCDLPVEFRVYETTR